MRLDITSFLKSRKQDLSKNLDEGGDQGKKLCEGSLNDLSLKSPKCVRTLFNCLLNLEKK